MVTGNCRITAKDKVDMERSKALSIHNFFKGQSRRMKTQLEQMIESSSTTAEAKIDARGALVHIDHLIESLKITAYDKNSDQKRPKIPS